MKTSLFLLALGTIISGMGGSAGAPPNLIAHYRLNDNLATDVVLDATGSHNGAAQQDTDIIQFANRLYLKTALVTFVFDDNHDTAYDTMKPVFDAQGEVACCAIVSDWVGGANKTTEAELVELEGDGWEILSHSKTHTNLTTLNEAQITTELSDSKTALEAMGLTIENLVYPYNANNTLVRTVSQDYYDSARVGGNVVNPQMLVTYALNSKDADDHTDLAAFKVLVDAAESGQSWVIFYLHSTDADDATAIGELIDYIQAKDIDIITVQQALDLTTSTAEFINGSFEFNGTSDYVAVPDDDDFTPAGTPFSISAWLKMDNSTSFMIASKGVLDTDGEWLFWLTGSDRLFCRLLDESVTNCYIGRSSSVVLTSYENQWVHVVLTYDGGTVSSGAKLHFNGIRTDDADNESNPGSFVSVENLNHDLWIGRYSNSYANGTIDNVYFFAAELTQDEVNILYNNGAGTEIPAELDQQMSPRRANLSPFSLRRRYEY